MVVEQAKPPRGLGVDGRRLWRSVAEELAADDLELTATERYWLTSACKLVDQAAVVEAELAKAASLYVKGSMGQQVANPLIGELRQLHLAASLTLARIKTDVPEAPSFLPALNKGRANVHKRWRGA